MSASDFWKKASCPHRNLTPEDGYARRICCDCGSVVTMRLTEDDIMRAVERAKRQPPL